MRSLAALVRDDRGALTIEFVLWVPVIVAMLLIAVDAATLYLTHTEMWMVARDTARRMTTGQITSAQDAETYAATAMSLRDYPYTVDAVYDPDDSMEVVIAVNFADIAIPGYSALTILGGDLTARVSMRSAPRVIAGGNGNGGGNGT